jgi:catechol 2,3-dioxygenase-like lactoylglutathione lyase family enzyme
MITHISLVAVWVRDISEALAFYTGILGFEVKDDIWLAEDFRWCTVVHPAQPELQVHLTTPSPPLSDDLIEAMQRAQAEGGMPGIGLTVEDCRATYEELSAKGVEFIQPPAERPYGVEALMRDNSGNWMVLVEPRAFDPAAMTVEDLG